MAPEDLRQLITELEKKEDKNVLALLKNKATSICLTLFCQSEISL